MLTANVFERLEHILYQRLEKDGQEHHLDHEAAQDGFQIYIDKKRASLRPRVMKYYYNCYNCNMIIRKGYGCPCS